MHKKDDDSEIRKINTEDNESNNNIEEFEAKYSREPKFTDCPFCKKRVFTEVDHIVSYSGIILSIILIFFLNLISIPFIMIVIPLTQNSQHRCPSCLNQIGECSFYDTISLSDRIISLTLGSFALVISKKQLIGIFVFLTLIVVMIMKFMTIDTSRRYIDESFDDFYKECNKSKFSNTNIANQVHIYCHSFRFSDVNWKGHVVRIDYERKYFSSTRLKILIKMREEDKSEDGDLYLKVEDYIYETYKNKFYELNRGDKIQFNATILFEGDGQRVPFLNLFEIEILKNEADSRIELSPHIHHNGRYSLDDEIEKNNDKIIHKNEELLIGMSDFVVEKDVNIENNHETYN